MAIVVALQSVTTTTGPTSAGSNAISPGRLVLAAVISIIASIITAWLTFQFVKRRELAEALQNEVKKLELVKRPEMALALENELKQQRQLLILEEQRDRETRTRQEILRWANPILGAVEGLESRLKNILQDHLFVALDPGQAGIKRPVRPDWAVSYDYTMPSTLFLFADYFAWIRLLQEQLSSELFKSQETEDRFFKAIWAVTSALSRWPMEGIVGKGQDAQVFFLQQRAIGEFLIHRDGEKARSMTVPEFLEALDRDQHFRTILDPLYVLLEAVKPETKRWSRLEKTLEALHDLRNECRDLLQLKNRS